MLVVLTTISARMFGAWDDLAVQVQLNKDSIRTLELSQFTAEQGRQLETRLMARMEEPPRWLTESVGRLERAAERIDTQVEAMRERLVRLEASLEKK
jgi:hypothetical protein